MENKYFDVKTSIFLDILRFLAAIVVFLVHIYEVFLPDGEYFKTLSNLAHGAVVVFFVLSGYVITFSITLKKRNFTEYISARFSRLYSIFLPAILLTIICSIIIFKINTSVYDEYNRGFELIRYLLSIFFLNEFWFFSASPPINMPMWSLGYEFWFYIIFGAFFYKKSGFKGWYFPLLLSIFIGPKVLLMMVIWIFGYFSYKLPKLKISNNKSFIFSIIFLLISLYMVFYLRSIPFELGSKPLFYSAQFIKDYFVGFLIAISIWFLPLSNNPKNGNETELFLQKKARTIGDLTFSIYILHKPIIILCSAVFPISFDINYKLLLSFLITITICVILGLFLESKKNIWKLFFDKSIYKLKSFFK